MLLDAEGVAVPQDAEQLVIRNEEEPGEGVPLGVQVVVQALLAFLKALTDVLQVTEAVWGLTASLDHRIFQGLAHDLDKVKKTKVTPRQQESCSFFFPGHAQGFKFPGLGSNFCHSSNNATFLIAWPPGNSRSSALVPGGHLPGSMHEKAKPINQNHGLQGGQTGKSS